MNARTHELRLTVELRQVPDAVQSIFHSLLLHRTLAKFRYQGEKNFSLGSVGIKEVECDHIDLTYARLNSPELSMCVDEDVRQFKNEVDEASFSGSAPRRTPSVGSPTESAVPLLRAQIGLDFYQKNRRQSVTAFGLGMLFGSSQEDTGMWEQWKLVLDIFRVESFDELQKMRHSVADSIGDIVLNICEQFNQPVYTPTMPSESEVSNVFDTRFSDCQPFLFKITRQAVPNITMRPNFTQVNLQRLKDVLQI